MKIRAKNIRHWDSKQKSRLLLNTRTILAKLCSVEMRGEKGNIEGWIINYFVSVLCVKTVVQKLVILRGKIRKNKRKIKRFMLITSRNCKTNHQYIVSQWQGREENLKVPG